MTLIIGRKRILDMHAAAHVRMQGWFTVRRVHAETGHVRQELTFPNVITNAGLDWIGSTQSNVTSYSCIVGTGTAVPAVTDTALGTVLASTDTQFGPIAQGNNASPGNYAWSAKTWRFPAGAAAGNISEVGVAFKSYPAAAPYLWSRQLILDGAGSPTTITVLANEYLDVTYELRLYPNLTPVTGTLTLTGGGSYAYTIAPRALTSWRTPLSTDTGAQSLNGYVAKAFGSTAAGATASLPASLTASNPTISAGALQSSGNIGVCNPNAYVAGTYKKTVNGPTASTSTWNWPSGILAADLQFTHANYQPPAFLFNHMIIFNDPIPKTVDNTMWIQTEISWGRYTI